jgi:hypothetical protein
LRGIPRAVAAIAVGLLVSARAPVLSAAERASDPSRACPCEASPEPHARLHDGFFVRAEAGLALLQASVSAPSRSRVRALGQASTLALGGTPARGLVVGGVLWASRLDPSFVEGGRQITPDDDSVKVTLARVGPFVSFYPDPRRGFHADASLALVLGSESNEKGKPLEPGFWGPGISFGIGHDWFIAQQFSLGVVSRAVFTRISRDSAAGPERWRTAGFELALSYTYH